MSTTRRCIYCAAFVAGWMACGWLFGLRAPGYLLLGVPLVAVFQRAVSGSTFTQLWVRDAKAFQLDRAGIALAGILMLAPVYFLASDAVPRHDWGRGLLLCAAMAGAVPAAFAVRQQRADGLKRALPSFVAAVVIGCGIMAFLASVMDVPPMPAPSRLPYLFGQFMMMFPLCFAVEEVAFRGALDTFVAPSRGKWWQEWALAIFISALWAMWHLPLQPRSYDSEYFGATELVFEVQIAIGVPLSFCWRRGGTLVLPAAAHALIDAYRNTLFP